jgi:putative transposase
MVSLSKDKAGRYFISMAVEEDIQTKAIAQGAIGIDLGINNAMILSDGTTIDNPRHLKRYKEQLKKLQQRLSRQTKKSNRWLETKRRIAKIHARTADCCREFIHRTTSKIVDENQIILIEDLNVKGMTASGKGTQEKPGKMVKQKSGLNRALLDVSLSEAIRQLEYKAAWYGRTLRKVDRFYPSSKTCSCCGHKLDKLSLDVRAWTCPDCNTTHDRDLNAAINIRDEGLRNMRPVGILGEVRDAGGEGACPMSVSPRSLDQSTACLEQVGRVI